MAVFGADPWWIVLIKSVGAFVLLLVMTLFTIVFERKVVGRMQHRLGPTMTGPFGWLQSLADGMKLMFKEDFRIGKADKIVFTLAPFISAVPAIAVWAVIPVGGQVGMFGHQTYLQVTDLPVSVLFIVALSSVGIYGIVLAGWSSNSPYSLLGGLRSSAQVISYEIGMGLSFVAVFLYAGSMSTHDIVEAQSQPVSFFGVPIWYCVQLIPSFVIYLISMVGETNRAPFDLPEAEGELVGGYHTEYTSMRFAMFFMAEYMNMITVSALATTLFLGGYKPFIPFNWIPFIGTNPWFGPLWFVLKIVGLLFIFVWLRGTLPRLRYDQFMNLGWKYIIPISLVWIVLVSVLRLGMRQGWFSGPVVVIIAIAFVVLVVVTFLIPDRQRAEEPERPPAAFDAFAGGYPVPPPAGQQLPDLAPVLVGATTDPGENGRPAAGEEPAIDKEGDS